MNAKMLLLPACCVFLTALSSPIFNYPLLAVSSTLDTQSTGTNPQAQAVNPPNSDVTLSDKVQDALKKIASSSQGENVKVNVESNNAIITLTGTVADKKAKDIVNQAVSNVPGVKGVVNKLEINN